MKRSENRPPPPNIRERSAILFVLPLLVIGLFVLRRASQMGTFPTGLDGGEWLAIGDGLLGAPGRSTGGAYAPLVPLLVASVARLTGAVEAVHLIAFATWVAMLLSIGWIAATVVNGWGTTVIVAAVASASTVIEPLAFGGYPQQLALAGLFVGVTGLARWLSSGSRRDWCFAATGLGVASLSHHLYGLIAILTSLAVIGLALLNSASRDRLRENLAGTLALLLLAAGLLTPTLLAMRTEGYRPPLDAAPRSVVEAWQYGTREAVTLWTMVLTIALLAVALQARRRRSALWLFTTAALIVSGLAFLIEPQPRLLPLLLGAALLAIANAAVDLPPEWWRSARLAATLASVVLITRGDGEASAFFRYYQVLDASLVSASRAVERSHPAGIVAVRAGRAGWPIGWWVDGLTTVPVATGSDLRWLGFPGERDSATAVDRLFDGSLTPSALRNEARTAGVSTLVLRKWDWIGWDRWLKAPNPAVKKVYDDNITLVLTIAPK